MVTSNSLKTRKYNHKFIFQKRKKKRIKKFYRNCEIKSWNLGSKTQIQSNRVQLVDKCVINHEVCSSSKLRIPNCV